MRLDEALAAVHDAPEIWCLAGPWSMLTWDVEPATLADLPPIAGVGAADSLGWSRFSGGWLMQADYFGAMQVVRVRSALVWGPDGVCTTLGGARLPASPTPTAAALSPRLAGPLQPAWDRAGHGQRVARIREHIAAGDCYQINLTLPFIGSLAQGDDLAVFRALLATSPAPFAGCIRRPGQPTIVSHSPECLVACAGGNIASAPIKGTRPRGRRAELLASGKDAAELTMIVDLVRNDLGRVAQTGSVRVSDAQRVIDLPYVHHRAAEVIAQLRPGTRWREVIDATFPAGSITGAPKRKAMELIDRYEVAPRGAYCGSFGWIGNDGAGQLNVAIRTALISGSHIAVHAGGGIVADSEGDSEWDEVRAKASALAAALGETL